MKETSPAPCIPALPHEPERAQFVRSRIPSEGLFAGQDWRIAPAPFQIGPELASDLENLGRVLLQFYRAANLLYRQSAAGKQPPWVAAWLDQGKPADIIELQRDPAFKNDLPRVIRPDLLLTDSGLALTELDSVPGGIGLTAWLNQTYSELDQAQQSHSPAAGRVIGGRDGMQSGFASIFGEAQNVHLVVSDESGTYRPEMNWLARAIDPQRVQVRDPQFTSFSAGDAVYRFFEMFDVAHVPSAPVAFDLARRRVIRLTPPPKPFLEEKIWLALLWNRHLQDFWRRELGQSFLERLLKLVPYSWVVDPAPLPPQGAIPELNLTDWRQLKLFSQRDRNLILKESGFSEHAWGARGVYLGSDLPVEEWSKAVDLAVESFGRRPFILQRYHKPALFHSRWFDFDRGIAEEMDGRVRLCPYYFVAGEGDRARAKLSGVLATICPANKKIIHGMKEAILAPCAA